LEEVIALLDCEGAAWLRVDESAVEFAQFRAISHLYVAVSWQAELASQCERFLFLVRLRQPQAKEVAKICLKNPLVSSPKRIFGKKNLLCNTLTGATQQIVSAIPLILVERIRPRS